MLTLEEGTRAKVRLFRTGENLRIFAIEKKTVDNSARWMAPSKINRLQERSRIEIEEEFFLSPPYFTLTNSFLPSLHIFSLHHEEIHFRETKQELRKINARLLLVLGLAKTVRWLVTLDERGEA